MVRIRVLVWNVVPDSTKYVDPGTRVTLQNPGVPHIYCSFIK